MSEFKPTDMAGLDEEIQKLPTDILAEIAEAGKNDLFFFNTGILKYKDMTVGCHGPLCAFVQHNPKRFKRILMPRDHYKSTCVTIGGSLWKVVRDPNERIHIKNEKEDNASRFLNAIKNHATGNKIFRTLYGQIIPPDLRKVRWNDTEVDFLGRSGTYPEPTLSVSGMTSATTSNHFSHIIIDDPISRNAVQSEPLMKEAINRVKDLVPLLTRPLYDTIWLVGTRWAFHDVYSWWDGAYREYTGKFARSAIEDGQPIFPELVSLELLDIERRKDEYLFSCIYMNNPRNAELQDLDVEALRSWVYADAREDVVCVFDGKDGTLLRAIPVAKLQITITVDLAAAEKATSDRNAIVVFGVDPDSGYGIVLDVFAERCTPLKVIDKLVEYTKRWDIWKVGIEGVAYQKAFKYFLQQHLDQLGLYMNIVEIKAIGKKEMRIKGLQPLVKVGRVAVHPTQQLLKNEMSEFPLGEHDDTVDALSMQLQIAGHWFSQERLEKFKAAEEKVLMRAGIIKDPYDDAEDDYWKMTGGRFANQSSFSFD